ncbi:MAG TPA: FkbM family methyltransferase [Saprospiraceae bacterium]|nr:FkbM family methyltransferase [Saprospiraceae bacterium]
MKKLFPYLNKGWYYDKLTEQIIRKTVQLNSQGIDIGSHHGEVLSSLLKYAPEGRHYAFEPLPELYELLYKRYGQKAAIYPYALSNENGFSDFHYIRNAPDYSGLRKRKYDIMHPDIHILWVEMRKLDDVIPTDSTIHFIKIDVEGGEFDVIKGSENLILNSRPIILFEFGMGASDYYHVDPSDFFDYCTQHLQMHLYTLKAFLDNNLPLSRADFLQMYESNKEYYFVMGPTKSG